MKKAIASKYTESVTVIERAAVEAIAADMLEEYGNAEDATNATAYGVFADMHDGARPDDLEPADMEQMNRLMTYAAEVIARIQQTAEQAAFEARNIAIVNAGKATKELESLTVCLEDGDAEEAETCANWCETAAEAAEDAARIAAEHASKAGTETAQEAAETAQEAAEKARELSNSARDAARPTYQRAELLAYLGEPDDYDVTAIEREATAYDPETGRTVWAVDADELAIIAERHQLQFYAPAF